MYVSDILEAVSGEDVAWVTTGMCERRGIYQKITISKTEKTMAGEIPLYADLLVTHLK